MTEIIATIGIQDFLVDDAPTAGQMLALLPKLRTLEWRYENGKRFYMVGGVPAVNVKTTEGDALVYPAPAPIAKPNPENYEPEEAPGNAEPAPVGTDGSDPSTF